MNCSVADNQIMHLRRDITNRFLTCEQLLIVLNCFKVQIPFRPSTEQRMQLGPHRAEAIVCCYGNLLDPENFWTVLYALQSLEQAIVISRLSPVTCFAPQHLSMHWILDVTNPSHADIAKKLVKAASGDTELPNLWNIRLNGTEQSCSSS